MDRLYSVIAVTNVAGVVQERIRYSAYGVPKVSPLNPGDVNGDGAVNFTDLNLSLAAFGGNLSSTGSTAYSPEADLNGDGLTNFVDYNIVLGAFGAAYAVPAEGRPSRPEVGNTVGYCGYLADPATGLWLARHRWHDPTLGRWISRDPIGYADGMNFCEYVGGMPLCFVDPFGLSAWGDLWDNLKGVPKEIPGVIRDWYRNPGKNLRDAEDGYNSLPDTVKRGIDAIPGGGGVQVVCAINNPTPGNLTNAVLSVLPGGSGKVVGGVLRNISKHAIDRIIQRNIAPQKILDALRNPIKRSLDKNGNSVLQGPDATVIVSPDGNMITGWPNGGRIR